MSPLPDILVEAFRTGEVFTPGGGKTPMHSNVGEKECDLLYEAVRDIRPEASLEIGFAQGISTLAILKALHDNGRGHHHVIDPYQAKFENCGIAMVGRSGLGDRFTFYEKFAEETVPSLPVLQFAFIDSSHLFDLTLCDFVLADKRMDIGGIIAFHDLWMPSLQSLVRFILANREYTVYGRAESPRPTRAQFLAKIARLVPGSRRIFSREFLKPWEEFALPNMVLLHKTGNDARDWRHYVAF